jgi:hypothetical protein
MYRGFVSGDDEKDGDRREPGRVNERSASWSSR